MSNIDKAKAHLQGENYTCVLCSGDILYTSYEKGISPMLDILDKHIDVRGFSAADKIVGRAAAMLFALAGVKELYAEVLSKPAAELLRKYGILFSYGTLTEAIINRKGDGICPMEEAVSGIDDLDQAFHAIKNKRDALGANAIKNSLTRRAKQPTEK